MLDFINGIYEYSANTTTSRSTTRDTTVQTTTNTTVATTRSTTTTFSTSASTTTTFNTTRSTTTTFNTSRSTTTTFNTSATVSTSKSTTTTYNTSFNTSRTTAGAREPSSGWYYSFGTVPQYFWYDTCPTGTQRVAWGASAGLPVGTVASNIPCGATSASAGGYTYLKGPYVQDGTA